VLAALRHGRVGERYNVGGNTERSNVEVVDAICAALERERPAASNPALAAKGISRYVDLKTFVSDRPGHDRRYAIDSSKIRAELGWRPAHDFDSGLGLTVSWYLANGPWCEAVQAGQYERQRLGLG